MNLTAAPALRAVDQDVNMIVMMIFLLFMGVVMLADRVAPVLKAMSDAQLGEQAQVAVHGDQIRLLFVFSGDLFKHLFGGKGMTAPQ